MNFRKLSWMVAVFGGFVLVVISALDYLLGWGIISNSVFIFGVAAVAVRYMGYNRKI